ncbi:histidine kinase [Amycolatopsis regifaucium]|uniref:histidine kinase n=1 Tax=Amycolatopsis regifaucium TaxID=546365 RepID=A0A154MIR5_9PSEU|nr:histidine kinase [Amycolatopsis regifaucium]
MAPLPISAALRSRVRAFPPLTLDVALVLLVMVVQLWPFFSRQNPAGPPWHWWGYLVVTASALPLLGRRRAPVVALLASLVATGSYDLFGDVPAQPIWYGALVATYTVAVRSAHRPRIVVLMITVGGSMVISSSETALRSGVMFIAAYAVGRAFAASRAHAEALRERAERLEHERRLEADRAAVRERSRIARDMHDILSHAVSVMVVQAEAGPIALTASPARAEAAFDAIASAGRDAMVQLRRILDLLKDDDGARSPQPTLVELPALVEQTSGTGLALTYDVRGEPVPLPPDVEVAAYRIIQEAITNTVKHSGAHSADLRLAWQDDTLMIDIIDDGRGSASSLPSGGNGLIGIRERTTACGGTVSAGPRTDASGFQVRVRLPLTPRGATV